MTDPLRDLRAAIDATDERIVLAVNERLRLVSELWQVKAALGVDRLDPGREHVLRARLASANRGPLSPEGLDALVTYLLDLTKRELA